MTSKKILLKSMTEIIEIERNLDRITRELIRCLGEAKQMKTVKNIHKQFKTVSGQRDRLSLVSDYVTGELLKK